MKLQYSQNPSNTAKAAKGIGRNFNISFKNAVVVCDKLRGMRLSEAITLMDAVVALERPIPFRKFNKGVGHRKGDNGVKIGKYPKKAASCIKQVLKNIEANAEFKGLDTEKLKITHIQALKGITRKRRKPKGRWGTWKTELINIQAIAEESR